MSDSNKDHVHLAPGAQEQFSVMPANPALADRPVDMAGAGLLIGASLAGCTSCQHDETERVLNGDPLVVMHLTAMVVLALRDQVYGGRNEYALPGSVLARFADPTQTLMRHIDCDPDAAGAQAFTEGLGRLELRWVLNDALDMLVGMLALGVL